MELYQRVSLIENIDKYGLKKGDVATIVDFVEHPQGGERGCVLEIINALGDTVDVITLPCALVELLKPDEILSVRHYSKAV